MRENSQIIEEAIVRLADQFRTLIDEQVLDELFKANPPVMSNEQFIDKVKWLLLPYKRSMGPLRGKKGISFQTYVPVFDITYNTNREVLVSIRIGADEDYDVIDLLSSTLEKMAREEGRKFTKAVYKDVTQLVVRCCDVGWEPTGDDEE